MSDLNGFYSILEKKSGKYKLVKANDNDRKVPYRQRVLCKDGSVDMRYKENKDDFLSPSLNEDGSFNWNYSINK